MSTGGSVPSDMTLLNEAGSIAFAGDAGSCSDRHNDETNVKIRSREPIRAIQHESKKRIVQFHLQTERTDTPDPCSCIAERAIRCLMYNRPKVEVQPA